MGEKVILAPKNRFFIFGEGKDALHKGIVAEGRIKERVPCVHVRRLGKKPNGKISFVRHKSRYNPEKKLEDFYALLDDAKVVTEFVFPARSLKRLFKYARENRSSHIRLFRKDGSSMKARAFDARKYFDELIALKKLANIYYEEDFSDNSCAPFYVYLKVKSLRFLPKHDFDVTVFDNELIEFQSLHTDLIFRLRDQRLGACFEEELTDRFARDKVLLLDSRRVQSGRYKKKKRKTPDPSS
jgi:hypothetical protein